MSLDWGWSAGGDTRPDTVAPRGAIATGNSNIPSGLGGGTLPAPGAASTAPATATPATTATGKYKNAYYLGSGKWKVFDGTSWLDSSVGTGDLYGQLDTDIQKEHPSEWWQDQAKQADYNQQYSQNYDARMAGERGAMGNTGYKYTEFGM